MLLLSDLAKSQVPSDVAAHENVPISKQAPAPEPSFFRDLEVVIFPGGGCTSSACCLGGTCHARPPPSPSGGSSPISSPVSLPTTSLPTGCDWERASMFVAKQGRLDAQCPPAFYYVRGLGKPVVAHFSGTNDESTGSNLHPISLQMNREGVLFKSAENGSLEFVAEEDVLYGFVLSDPSGQYSFFNFQLYPGTSESYCAYACQHFYDEWGDEECECRLNADGSYTPIPNSFLECNPTCLEDEIPAKIPTISVSADSGSSPNNDDQNAHIMKSGSPPCRRSFSALSIRWILILGFCIFVTMPLL